MLFLLPTNSSQLDMAPVLKKPKRYPFKALVTDPILPCSPPYPGVLQFDWLYLLDPKSRGIFLLDPLFMCNIASNKNSLM